MIAKPLASRGERDPFVASINKKKSRRNCSGEKRDSIEETKGEDFLISDELKQKIGTYRIYGSDSLYAISLAVLVTRKVCHCGFRMNECGDERG